MSSSSLSGQDEDVREKYSALEKCAKAHRGQWRMKVMLRQCQEMIGDEALQQEAFTAVLSLSQDKLDAGRALLEGLPEPLLAFSLALCTCRRGSGGRDNAPDPKRDAKVDPLKAQHIMKKRHSAGLAKFKQKVANLAEAAREAGLVSRTAAELGLLTPVTDFQPAGSYPAAAFDLSNSQQQPPAPAFLDTDPALLNFVDTDPTEIARILRGEAAAPQQHQQQQEGFFFGGDACAELSAAAIEDVWAQFGGGGAQDTAQQYGGDAAGFQGCAASGSSAGSALFAGQGLIADGRLAGGAGATAAAGGAVGGGSQQGQQQGDLSWLLEDADVPGSPTLAALLGLDVAGAGGPCGLQLPAAGQMQPQPPAAPGTGELAAAGSHAGAAPPAAAAGSNWQAPWLAGADPLARQLSMASTQQQLGAGSSISASTVPTSRVPTPFQKPQVQLQQLADQRQQDQDMRQQLLLQLLSPAASATAQAVPAAAAGRDTAPNARPDPVAVAVGAAVDALAQMAGSPNSSCADSEMAGQLLSLLRPLAGSANPGPAAAHPTASRQPSVPMGGPQDAPADLSSLMGAVPAGLRPAAPALGATGQELDRCQGSSWDAAAAYAARVAAHARDSGGVVLNVAVAAAAAAGEQEAQAGGHATAAGALGAAPPAPQQVNTAQAAQQQEHQQGGPAAAGGVAVAAVPAPALVPAPLPAAAAPVAAPAPVDQVSPLVQALLQQLDFLVQHNAPNILGAALDGFFPLLTAAAQSGHNIRPVLTRLYSLLQEAAAMQVRHLQGLMQQLEVAGHAADLDRGMQLVLQLAAFPGLAVFAAQVQSAGAAQPAHVLPQTANIPPAAVAPAAIGVGAQMPALLQQLQQQAGPPNGAGRAQWFNDVIMQLRMVQ